MMSVNKLFVLTTLLLWEAFIISAFSNIYYKHDGIVSRSKSTIILGMGKGLNKARNKQMDLRRKLELAKQQKEEGTPSSDDDKKSTESKSQQSSKKLSASEIKEKNDRLRFEELLKNQGSSGVFNDYASDGYLNTNQEEEEISAQRAGVDRVFEGDPAPEQPFENLVSMHTQNAIAKKGAKRIYPSSSNDFLIIISDPREKSVELRQTIKGLQSEISVDLWSKLIFINADSPSENRRFLKKSNLLQDENTSKAIRLYSDEKMEWMRSYTALGDKRWSMTMFIISGNGRVIKLARELDVYNVGKVIQNAVKSI